MGERLKRAALDLFFTPYSILATLTAGLVRFVGGLQVLLQYNRPDVMSTYLRSLAGYCVLPYLLVVGDRHLDDILLRSTGHFFFHIDFGFIFGHDPKPLPPAFRLTREVSVCWS
jgi:phosphatidylinositol 3-kinase